MSLDTRGTQCTRINSNLCDLPVEKGVASGTGCIVGLRADHFRQVERRRVDCKRNWRTRNRSTINEQHNLRTVIGHCDVSPTAGGDDSTGTVHQDPTREVGTETTPNLGVEGKGVDGVLTPRVNHVDGSSRRRVYPRLERARA